MRIHALGLAALLALSAGPSPRVMSLSVRRYCARGHLSVETEWREDSLVFVGTVRSARRVASPDGECWDRTVYRVRVDEAFRGHPAAEATLYSENDSGRFPMLTGRPYVLFASEWDGHLRVDNCGNSGPLPAAAPVLARVRALRREAGHH